MPALSAENTHHVAHLARDCVYLPLRRIFVAAIARGEIRPMHPDLLAGSFLWLIDGISYGQTQMGAPPREVMVDDLISLLLDGLRPRHERLQ